MGVLSNLTTAGYSYSDYPTTLAYVKNIFTSIYGSTIYLEADSQDGQLCAAFALAIYDTNAQMASIIQTLSPTYAQGTQLSNEVLINGISRKVATPSTVTLTIVGTVGTVISSASAKDASGTIWNITNGVIPISGTIDLFATASTLGAITALPNTITIINTPIVGWTSVNNALAATTGTDAESDYQLRQRQAISVAEPSQTNLTGVLGGLLVLQNVIRAKVYENYTGTTDGNGLPAHSISAVVDGGSGQLIANTIATRKTIGANTYGTASYTAIDSAGASMVINFFVCTYVNLGITIHMTALTGYASTTATAIQTSIAAYINGLAIGDTVMYTRLFTPANLNGNALSQTYDITSLTIGILLSTYGTANIAIPFNKAAKIQPSDIVIIIP